MKERIHVHIRWMIVRDYLEVLEIDRKCNPKHAWMEDELTTLLRRKDCIGMIAERGEKVIGFFVYVLHKKEIQLLRICVDPKYAGRGVDWQIMDKLKSKLSPIRRTSLMMAVRETELPLQLFFRTNGLKSVKVMPGFFEDGEDAYQMEYHLQTDLETHAQELLDSVYVEEEV